MWFCFRLCSFASLISSFLLSTMVCLLPAVVSAQDSKEELATIETQIVELLAARLEARRDFLQQRKSILDSVTEDKEDHGKKLAQWKASVEEERQYIANASSTERLNELIVLWRQQAIPESVKPLLNSELHDDIENLKREMSMVLEMEQIARLKEFSARYNEARSIGLDDQQRALFSKMLELHGEITPSIIQGELSNELYLQLQSLTPKSISEIFYIECFENLQRIWTRLPATNMYRDNIAAQSQVLLGKIKDGESKDDDELFEKWNDYLDKLQVKGRRMLELSARINGQLSLWHQLESAASRTSLILENMQDYLPPGGARSNVCKMLATEYQMQALLGETPGVFLSSKQKEEAAAGKDRAAECIDSLFRNILELDNARSVVPTLAQNSSLELFVERAKEMAVNVGDKQLTEDISEFAESIIKD